ncbi:hypothetical protein AVEN_267669-1 [Araneus ventricosus]|uniref:Uncharacterized protein n=1 Tax=Araneus ventricosus TaxID=182803 RepID=A0A4Y2NFH8_ARAVE|nr:hypothetical protein AVEN_267669-1 [Araneus ventricosus]
MYSVHSHNPTLWSGSSPSGFGWLPFAQSPFVGLLAIAASTCVDVPSSVAVFGLPDLLVSAAQPVMNARIPRCELKQHLQELFLKKWQNLWDNGNTGSSVHKVLKIVNLKPVFWTREEILFVTGHGPFPSFFNHFHLSDSDSYACAEVGDPIRYATSCPLTLSWRIRKPSTSLESL